MLLLLSLLSSALAAPQYFYPALPLAYNPYYPYQRLSGPLVYYPEQAATFPSAGNAMTRTISFGNFLQVNGEFMADSTTTPARVIEGTFNIQQNGLLDAFSGQDAKLSVYVRSSGGVDLNGKELKVQLGTGADCTAAAAGTVVDLFSVTGPLFSINGFYIKGTTTGYNLDGSNSKMMLMGATNWLMIADSTGVIGCSKAALQ